MRAFEYASPTTKEQAVSLLGNNWADADILAGGTDLLALMKDDVITPKRLVNIKDINELRGITVDSKRGLRIGALVTIQELADHPQVRKSFSVVAKTANEIAGPQIRNMATIGGNLCQRPRCWYYRAGFGLLAKDESGESLVPGGDNRYHAILGNSGPAYFVSPSTLAPLLIALGATVRLFGPKGKREIPLEKFFVIPQSESDREHDLMPNEIVTEVIVPPLAGVKSASYEVRQKDAMDWPLAFASVALTMSGGKVSAARVVMGHVAPVPWRSKEAEAALVGKAVTEATAKAAGDAAVAGAKSLGRNGYKIQLARVAVKRAILEAAKGGAK
ncbi:MAG TPA: xanthine dehydrogenase family protein subunit M [Blastocatellia bacterium]|nr:xanthine dehydrogenase family protein subunit M [Blastocatellia bacterium]